jgi:hypothetical protein
MSLSQRVCKTGLLLAGTLLAACGTGISPDPGALDRSRGESPKDDVSSDETGDSSSEDAKEEDARPPDEASESDADAAVDRFDGQVAIDVSSDGPRGDARDVGSNGDASDGSDVGAGGSVDVDGAHDAQLDAPVDASFDVTSDQDASVDARPGAKDGGDEDASNDLQADVIDAFGVLDVPDACPIGCDPDEYFIDAHAAPGGNGSMQAPFQTVSAAIDAHAHAPVRARTAHVAAGTYDASLGETFPLVLRGLSLQGAGADQTQIVGSGLLDRTGQDGLQSGRYRVTMVVGDSALATDVSRLSVRPTAPVPTTGFYGLFCDRGNANGEVASPSGQTHLDQISAGPGFDIGAVAVASSIPFVTGCNLLVTRSTFTGGWTGVMATGNGNTVTAAPVLLEVGTADPSSGNTFSWMQAQTGLGFGVAASGRVKQGSFQYNTFTDSAGGITVNEPLGPDAGSCTFRVSHNTFERLSTVGLYAEGSLNFVEEISDNRFSSVSQVHNQSSNRGVGMRIFWSNVGKVRRNVFTGNDIGVWLEEGAEVTDFGRAGDPGQNAFYCNSAEPGADLYIYYRSVLGPFTASPRMARSSAERRAGAPLSFVGNGWDHVPQRIGGTNGANENGIEVYLSGTPDLQFDFSDSSLVTTPCPPGRIP